MAGRRFSRLVRPGRATGPAAGLTGCGTCPDATTMSDPLDLHRRLLTLDTHIDIPWPDGPAFAAETQRRVDLPKMRRGLLACGFFAAYVPQTRRSRDADEAAFARAIAMLEEIRAMGEVPGARLCRTADEIAD